MAQLADSAGLASRNVCNEQTGSSSNVIGIGPPEDIARTRVFDSAETHFPECQSGTTPPQTTLPDR
jgi:hypothetical protein